MKFGSLMQLVGKQGWFDLASLVQMSNERRESLCVQLHRWCKAGKLHPLRRGMYAFAEEYLRTAIHGPELSNQLYTPSYLSLQWTLGYYGMIPEKVVVFTGVTSRSTQCFQNTFGTFDYRHVKPSAFFGYRRVTVNGKGILLAEPEKALLDLWHLERGEWSEDRMAEMRFQQFDMVNDAKLLQYAERFGSPRISAAVQVWMEVAKRETEGTVQL